MTGSKILPATKAHIPIIIEIAFESWPVAYKGIVEDAQITYMLKEIYQPEKIAAQLQNPNHHFFVLFENDVVLGYAQSFIQEKNIKLSKLYLRPSCKGKGYGKQLIEHVEANALQLGYSEVELCVNRGNKAFDFYEHQGYQNCGEINIPFGPYFMTDYLMRKQL
jgi:GNAT superfamily N-acetyltransferase